MKKRLKKIACLGMAVACILSANVNVFAAGKPLEFILEKNKGTSSTSAVAKADNEKNSYITINYMSYSTKDPCIAGLRVRKTNGTAVTDYKTYRTSVKSDKRPHLAGVGAKKGTACVLRGQVDSSSGATVIGVHGLWLP